MKNKLVIMFSVFFLFTACEQTTTVNYEGVNLPGSLNLERTMNLMAVHMF